MRLFGLVIETARSHDKAVRERKRLLQAATDKTAAHRKLMEADITSANKQIGRLLHKGIELSLLWEACRECTVDKQVRVVYERLTGKLKGGK